MNAKKLSRRERALVMHAKRRAIREFTDQWRIEVIINGRTFSMATIRQHIEINRMLGINRPTISIGAWGDSE